MSECSLLTPLRRDGTSQRQRMPDALDPRRAPVDARSTADLLLYAADLARLLRFYTEENTKKGDWSAFLEYDVSTIAARVGAYDVEGLQEDFERRREATRTATPAAFPAAVTALAEPVFTLAEKFEEWRRGSLEGLLLRTRLDRLIEGVLAEPLRETIRVVKRAAPVNAAPRLPTASTPFDAVWGDLNPAASPDTLTSETDRLNAVRVVAHAFERLYEAARLLAAQAPRFLAETLARYPQHRPHVALFLAFLRLFNHARGAMNALTAGHLDFYYRRVLQLVPRGPVADRVHVIFELAKNLPPFPVKADTELSAGKDDKGVPLLYATDSEIVVNHASLHPEHGLKTVFVDLEAGSKEVVRNIHAAADADAAAIAPPVNGEPRWPTFGNATLPYARIGFAVASPMLWLAEGTRVITVGFDLAPPSAAADVLAGRPPSERTAVELELTHNVVVEATGPKGWIAATATATIASDMRRVTYVVTIPASEPEVVALNPDVHHETFDTTLPVLRFVLRSDGLPDTLLLNGRPSILDYWDETPAYAPGTLVRFEGRVYQASQTIKAAGVRPTTAGSPWVQVNASPYKYFNGMRIQRVALAVDVKDMRQVIVESDAGPLNPAKPFMPFGPHPREGSSLLVGSWEIFQKALTNVTLNITWAGPPDVNFGRYYEGWDITDVTVTNGYFTADVEILQNGAWQQPPARDNLPLFVTVTAPAPEPAPDPALTVSVRFVGFAAKPSLEPIRRFEPGLDRGFLRLRLNTTFFHERLAAALANYVAKKTPPITTTRTIAANGTETTTTTPATPPTPLIPNPPYTPLVSSLTVEYTAQQTLEYASWTRAEVEGRIERLFQIGPFGHQEFAPVPPGAAIPGVEAASSPVPVFAVRDDDRGSGTAEGSLYLGIANLTPPQNVSFLFQMAEGSEDPDVPAQDVRWAYLTASGWKDFARAEILADTTDELIASGIVQFAVPKAATSTPTILPPGLHWLRATVRRHTKAIPKAVAVVPQAVQASFRDAGNDPGRLERPLPGGTIAKPVQREASIKSVSQPFSSFGGRPPERDHAFRIRVAERLRHKRRAVTIFDYERLVLERFPEVYKVRCLSHTGRDPDTRRDSEYAPGFVRVVVVPNLRNRNAVDPLRPRLALARLEEIRRDLIDMATDFAEIEVVNPDYEEVRVRTDVRFGTGFDKGFYTGQLERDIIRFLSPWLYDEGVDLTFGGRVHRSAILNFVEEREYVDFVAHFHIDHIVPGPKGDTIRIDVEEAQPTKSSAVIVPARTHHVGDDIVSCVDEPPGEEPPAPPPAPALVLPPGTPRYLGNSHTRELHDLLNITRYCQIDEIAIDRKYPIRSVDEARALGYDFCAYCFGPEFSQR
ncbi:MAG: hypothetical protein HYY76_02610 [Acidobacteria bacterium]|nr:hypothetical protein [Acidobacteriota bacterium]